MIGRKGVKEVAKSILGKIIKEPMLHFLVAGLVLFLGFSAVENGGIVEPDNQIIVVDRAALLTFLQFRSRAFDLAAAERAFASMSDETRDALIEEYVHEEALYRDALAMGLDDGDDIIRRRLVQKAEFLAQGFVELGLEVDDEMARAYFVENRNLYREPGLITFTHVFFDAEVRGENEVSAAANAVISLLNTTGVTFSEAIEFGDRFPFHLNYVERGPEDVAAHFGPQMAEELFELTPSDNSWAGPFRSPYGAHVVMVTLNRPARDLEFEEVRERVISDVTESEMHRRTEMAIDGIIAAYELRVDLSVEPEVDP